MLVTNNKKIYLKSKLLRNHGMIKNIQGKNNWYYNIIDVGFNYRMNEMQQL